MKNKIFMVVVIVFICFITASCKKDEYQVIEINSEEFINAFTDKKSFVLATINEQNVKYEQYLSDLQKLANIKKQNIYYLDFDHIVFEASIYLREELGIETNNLSFTTFRDGNIVETVNYIAYGQLKQTLGDEKYKDKLNRTSEEDINEYLTKARESYDEGFISDAYNYLSLIWNTNEAKEEYKNNKYYNIVKEWENFEQLDNNQARINALCIYPFANLIYTATKVDDFENFEMPDLDDYESVNYKIEDDTIYTAKDEDSNYKKYATIKSITDNNLVIEKNNKEYIYLIMESE